MRAFRMTREGMFDGRYQAERYLQRTTLLVPFLESWVFSTHKIEVIDDRSDFQSMASNFRLHFEFQSFHFGVPCRDPP